VLEDKSGVGQDGNGIGLELGIGRTSGFELATEDKGEDAGAFGRQGEISGEKDLGRPVRSVRPMPMSSSVRSRVQEVKASRYRRR
jgi:hypothetical protein